MCVCVRVLDMLRVVMQKKKINKKSVRAERFKRGRRFFKLLSIIAVNQTIGVLKSYSSVLNNILCARKNVVWYLDTEDGPKN